MAMDVAAADTHESNNMEKSEKEAKNRVKEVDGTKLPTRTRRRRQSTSSIQQNITSSDIAGRRVGRDRRTNIIDGQARRS